MRFLILTDIHANWPALETVVGDAEGQYDQIVCCGDLVGYNPDPDQVCTWVRDNCQLVIRGNHDKVVSGLEELNWFNEVARTAALWTMKVMDAANIAYLKSLPRGPADGSHFALCHGSPDNEDRYVTTADDAVPSFEAMDGNLMYFGHTHLQGGFAHTRNRLQAIPAVKKGEVESVFQLAVDTQYLINPGSVGQPRDGDPRAGYALYETESKVVTLRRVAYPIRQTVAGIQSAGLPDILGVRLLHGL